jgi:two-component system, NarL family, response regulator LiaR
MEILLNGSTGFHCCGAFDSAETALRSLPILKPDVALVDIHLPGISGIELVKCIREMMPETLCMMCTAYDQDDDVFQALQSGAHGYILKSTPPAKILEAIQELKNGGSPMSNEIARKVVISFQHSSIDRAEFDLTKREKETLALLSQGLLYKEIASRLSVTLDTVRRHCFNIYTKLHVNNRTEAINKYFGNHHH